MASNQQSTESGKAVTNDLEKASLGGADQAWRGRPRGRPLYRGGLHQHRPGGFDRSLPVNKKVGDEGYSGSIAKQGEMSAVVIATGNDTFFGRTASLVATAGSAATHSQRATTQIGDFERIINYILFRVAMSLDIMFVVVLATIFFGFSPLTPVMIILIALLDDIPIMTIAYDNTRLPGQPVRSHMRRLLLVSGFMRLMSVAETFGLLILCVGWLKNPKWQSWITLTRDQLQTIIFLQIVAGGHLLLFVMRSRGTIFTRPLPAAPLEYAIVGTQIFAGFGWFVPANSWAVIGLVWLYMIIWTIALDGVKLWIYTKLKHIVARQRVEHPVYQTMLRGSAG